ncbi:MAG: hypothetical protein JNK79_20680 [Chitinophagaceae bacterium]|nr:hypothetical protein [Chitinophagaceae bacterium]
MNKHIFLADIVAVFNSNENVISFDLIVVKPTNFFDWMESRPIHYDYIKVPVIYFGYGIKNDGWVVKLNAR